MIPRRWARVKEVFHSALARDPASRTAFLSEACQGDAELRREVETLLGHHEEAGSLLEPPAGVLDGVTPPAPARAMLAEGRRLGPYEVLELLGAGGMGEVYRARDTRLGREVAIKVLPTGVAADPERVRRFEHEARAASALNHPAIVTVHDVGRFDSTLFIVMERVKGRTLMEILRGGPLPPGQVLSIAAQLAAGLAKAHGAGIVHRDLKPANVIVTEDGFGKILDFGLAKLQPGPDSEGATASYNLSRSGIVLGTPGYMSPEQAKGGRVDFRADQFSLGAMLYEMATGQAPFRRSSVAESLAAVLHEQPPPLARVNPAASAGLQPVVERCLAKDPLARYDSTRELAAILDGLREGQGASRRPTAWSRPVGRRGLVALGAVVLLGAGLWLWQSRAPTRSAPGSAETASIKLAVLPFENLTGDPEQEYFSDGLTDEMITQLGRLHPQRLSVIARTSSMRYKNRDAPIDQIGRELGVDYVLEGSVRRDGSRVRISATLIQVRDQTQQWADSFDRELAGVLALQGDVAQSVARSLRLALLPAEQRRLGGARPVNAEAYEAYLKGMFHMQRLTRADLDLAQKYFEVALRRDPDYAPAYAGIASVWMGRNQSGYVPPSEATPKARAAATRALELDSTLALAHYALAGVAWAEWDWETNERELRRAIELDPNDPKAPTFYAHLLIALKRPEEAVSQAERAMQLDPLNAFNQALYGVILYFVRRYDEAIAQFQRALSTTPDSPLGCGLWYAYNMTGKPEQALMAAQGCLGHYSRDVKDLLARGYSEAGYAGTMRRVGDRLAGGVSGVYVAPIDVFLAYVHGGQNELAVEWLSKSVDARDPNVPGAVRDPFVIDSLGDDPRFQEILRRARLPI